MARPVWGIRVATDPRRGAGHVARCTALAEALGREAVVFFSDPENPHAKVLSSVGREIVVEPDRTRASRLRESVRSGQLRRAIFDSYDVGDDELVAVSAHAFVAKFRDRPPYGPEDVSIDLAPGAVPSTRVLAGPAFAPLRSAFVRTHSTARQARPPRNGGPLRLLLAFGAVDSANLTSLALDAAQRATAPFDVTILMHATARHLETIRARTRCNPDVRLVIGAREPEKLYLAADLAIGSPGVSQLERLCCGLPSVLIAQSDVHDALVTQWSERGAAFAGTHERDVLVRLLDRLAGAPGERAAVRARGLVLVDGRGAARLAAALRRIACRTG